LWLEHHRAFCETNRSIVFKEIAELRDEPAEMGSFFQRAIGLA
jgi:hypothetical protein